MYILSDDKKIKQMQHTVAVNKVPPTLIFPVVEGKTSCLPLEMFLTD